MKTETQTIMTIPAQTLSVRLAERVGYGNVGASVWFIGMEEGFGSSAELPVRFAAPAVEDLRDALKKLRPFDPREYDDLGSGTKLQATWRRLMLAHLVAHEKPSGKQDLRELQSSAAWGGLGGEVLLAELSPLLNHGLKSWEYSHFAGVGFRHLISRKDFNREALAKRVDFFAQLLHKNNPKVVVAYGLTPPYKSHFEKLLGDDGDQWKIVPNTTGSQYRYRSNYAIIPHPTSVGVSDNDYRHMGKWMGSVLKQSADACRDSRCGFGSTLGRR